MFLFAFNDISVPLLTLRVHVILMRNPPYDVDLKTIENLMTRSILKKLLLDFY